MRRLTEMERIFIGSPECRLRRFTKTSAKPAFFCPQCKHFSRTNECPFAGRSALAQSEEKK